MNTFYNGLANLQENAVLVSLEQSVSGQQNTMKHILAKKIMKKSENQLLHTIPMSHASLLLNTASIRF